MKRIALAIVVTCLTLSLMAQNGIKVNYKGSKPTVADFAWAAFYSLNHEDEDESGDRPWRILENAMERYSKGLPQEEGEKLVIDSKNGYILFEKSNDEYVDYIFRLEVCFWNESDGKHKLIAFNDMASFVDGKPSVTETSNFVSIVMTMSRNVWCVVTLQGLKLITVAHMSCLVMEKTLLSLNGMMTAPRFGKCSNGM